MDATNELTTMQSLLRNACSDVLRLENVIKEKNKRIESLEEAVRAIAGDAHALYEEADYGELLDIIGLCESALR